MRTVDPEVWFDKAAKKEAALRGSVKPTSLHYLAVIEVQLRGSFKDSMSEFRQHSSFQGMKYISHFNTDPFIRYLTIIIIVCLMMWGTTVMVVVNLEFSQRPPLQVNQMVTSLASSISFPAVAICSNGLITKQALNYYAAILDSQNKNKTYSLAAIKRNLRKFGSLVTLNEQTQDLDFMKFLYSVHPYFNVTKLMYWLSPNCSSSLKKCSWRGHGVDCDRLFAARATPLGYCCVFNSQYQPEDVDSPPNILDLVGQTYGLGVVVQEDSSDFAVVRRPTEGFDVLLFDGSEYPLLEGGSVRRYPVARNTSAYFALTAHAQYPSSNLRTYGEQWRGCRLKKLQGPRTALTSYSWCLAECRRRTAAALCNCRPFTLLPEHSDVVCTPEHLYCLTKHREKLVYYYPGRAAGAAGLAEEAQDSQHCPRCAPDCGRQLHHAAVYHAIYYYPHKHFKSAFAAGTSMVNTTVLRFYYNSINHHVYSVDISLRWYEALATLSCQARFLVGFSVINLSELIYFCTIRWAQHYLRWRRLPMARKKQRFSGLLKYNILD